MTKNQKKFTKKIKWNLCVCLLMSEKTIGQLLQDKSFKDSTSQGRTLRMDFLKMIIKSQINMNVSWINTEKILRAKMLERFPSMSHETKEDYLHESQEYFDAIRE